MIGRRVVVAALLLCAGCAGAQQPATPGAALKPCPGTPNCVSSRERDPAHRVEPLPLRGSAAEGLAAIRQVILAMPRSRIVAEGPRFLHAEFRSRVFRFVDDVDLLVDEAAGVIHVRSAARIGRSDFGVNRARIGEMRERLAALQPRAADQQR